MTENPKGLNQVQVGDELGEAAKRSRRWDKFVNELSKLGGSKDKSQRNKWEKHKKRSYRELENIYESNGYAQRIIDLPARDATRNGWEYSIDSSLSETEEGISSKEIKQKEQDLGLRWKIRKADTWARLYGGSILFLGVEDGKSPSQPIDGDIESIEFAEVYSRKNVDIAQVDSASKGRGEPVQFKISQAALEGLEHMLVHRDRVLFFPGEGTPTDSTTSDSVWGSDVLNPIWSQLTNFIMADNALGHMLHEANTGIWKLQGLDQKFETDRGKQRTMDRISGINMSHSLTGMFLMDLEREDYEEIDTNVDGVAELHKRLAVSLSAVTGIPIVMLMGDSQKGFGDDDKAGTRNWNKLISSRQSDIHSPKLKKFANLVASSKIGTDHGVVFDIEFGDLFELADLQKSEMLLNKAKAAEKLAKNGVFEADELRAMFESDLNLDIE